MDSDVRAPTIYGWLAALLGGGALLYFWVMAFVVLLTRNGGQIQFLHDEPVWRALFYSYPVVLVVAVLLGGVLAAFRRDLLSVGVAAAPVGLAIAYYLALVYARPF